MGQEPVPGSVYRAMTIAMIVMIACLFALVRLPQLMLAAGVTGL